MDGLEGECLLGLGSHLLRVSLLGTPTLLLDGGSGFGYDRFRTIRSGLHLFARTHMMIGVTLRRGFARVGVGFRYYLHLAILGGRGLFLLRRLVHLREFLHHLLNGVGGDLHPLLIQPSHDHLPCRLVQAGECQCRHSGNLPRVNPLEDGRRQSRDGEHLTHPGLGLAEHLPRLFLSLPQPVHQPLDRIGLVCRRGFVPPLIFGNGQREGRSFVQVPHGAADLERRVGQAGGIGFEDGSYPLLSRHHHWLALIIQPHQHVTNLPVTEDGEHQFVIHLLLRVVASAVVSEDQLFRGNHQTFRDGLPLGHHFSRQTRHRFVLLFLFHFHFHFFPFPFHVHRSVPHG